MTLSTRWLGTTTLFALTVALVCAGSGSGQGTTSAKDLAALIEHDAKIIQDDLSKSTVTKKSLKRARTAAFLIAAYAQHGSNKENAQQMATLRDAALKAVKLAEDGKGAEVKAIAATLSTKIKADPAAKTSPVALEKHHDLESVMRVFSSERVGGFNLEKLLEDAIESKGADAEKIALLGHKIAIVGELALHFPPESDSGKKTKKAWAEHSKEMSAAAHAFAQAAAKKDAGVGKAAEKLSATCIACHDIFR